MNIPADAAWEWYVRAWRHVEDERSQRTVKGLWSAASGVRARQRQRPARRGKHGFTGS